MATRGEMITRLAGIFQTLEGTVDVLDRALADGGLRARSPRGRALAAMSALDVVHVTFALTGRRYVRNAAAEVREITGMPLRRGECQLRVVDPETEGVNYEKHGSSLTPEGILHGHFLQNYPRDQIPLGDTFGESLAHIVDQLPDIRDLSGLRVIVRWDPLVAEIGFRLEDKLYRIEFGDVDSPENPDLPFFTFGYREPFLRKIAGILRD